MSFTGGLAGWRRGWLVPSCWLASSGQMSARSSDISTNSSAKMRFTTLGGRAAAGLYGPAACRLTDTACGIASACWFLWVAASPAAAAASRSSPDATPVAGTNVGSAGSSAGFGNVPSGWVRGPAWGGGGGVAAY